MASFGRRSFGRRKAMFTRRAGRRTNVVLFVLLAAAFATGAGAYATGTAWGRWVVVAHGVVGLGILVLSPWKSVVARRGLARRRPGHRASLFFTVLVLIALAFGVLHSTGLWRSLGPLTAMQIHVGAALLALPFALWHIAARPARAGAADMSRRNFVNTGALFLGAGAAYLAVEGITRLTGLGGSRRRFTGSFETSSMSPEGMPVTQWFNDSVQTIDEDSWALTVQDAEESRRWGYDELSDFDDAVRAVLDCTGGWYSEQDWEGVWLSRLIEGSTLRSVDVTSATGYARRFPMTDSSRLLVATRVGGAPLVEGHGFPARIVAPNRRGFWWVKWITRIETTDRPWWAQPPFPLT